MTGLNFELLATDGGARRGRGLGAGGGARGPPTTGARSRRTAVGEGA